VQKDDDDFDIAEAFDRSLYEAIAAYDSSAGLNRWLSLRFTGDRVDGRLPEQAVEDVLGALRREIAGASSTRNAAFLRLDLVGFSRGSAILHLVPAAHIETPDESVGMPENRDELDKALVVITELHTAMEAAEDVQRFSGQNDLLKGFKALSEALDKHGLDVGITWRNSTGRHQTSRITSRGRDHARQYFDRSVTTDIIHINGRVVELDISGSFHVKAGSQVNSQKFKISVGSEAALLGLGLSLGLTVQVRVRRHSYGNKVGVVYNHTYEFLDMVRPREPLN